MVIVLFSAFLSLSVSRLPLRLTQLFLWLLEILLILRLADCPVGHRRNRRFKFKGSPPLRPCCSCLRVTVQPPAFLLSDSRSSHFAFPIEGGWLNSTPSGVSTASDSEPAPLQGGRSQEDFREGGAFYCCLGRGRGAQRKT